MADIPEQMQAIDHGDGGGAEVMQIVQRPVPTPQAHEVLIKVVAAGVNGPDLKQRAGSYPPPPGASPILGLEVSGEIAAVGADVRQYAVGDKVCALTNGGGYAGFVAVDAQHCLPIPQGVEMLDAAGLCETFFTVWSNIWHRHTVAKGACLLVHGGGGGIGSTAIQIGRAMGVRVFATAGSQASRDLCEELGAERVIDYHQEDFVEILRAAGGADIILDIIGGDYIARNIKASRHDGRIIQLAFEKGSKVEINLMPLMLKRLVLTGATLRSRPDAFKSAVAEELRTQIWPLFAKGQLRTVTHSVLPLAEAAKAHTMLEKGGICGKVLLQI